MALSSVEIHKCTWQCDEDSQGFFTVQQGMDIGTSCWPTNSYQEDTVPILYMSGKHKPQYTHKRTQELRSAPRTSCLHVGAHNVLKIWHPYILAHTQEFNLSPGTHICTQELTLSVASMPSEYFLLVTTILLQCLTAPLEICHPSLTNPFISHTPGNVDTVLGCCYFGRQGT